MRSNITAAICLALSLPSGAFAEATMLRITSPMPDQSVSVRPFVRGEAPPGTKQVWLIVHPLETDDCWAQGPGIVNADGTWRIIGQFGEAGIQDAKKPYEVRAIANPHLPADKPLEAGPVSCGLDAQLHSESVDVIRD